MDLTPGGVAVTGAERFTFGDREYVALSLVPCQARRTDGKVSRETDALVKTLELLCPLARVEIRVLTDRMLTKRFEGHGVAAGWVQQFPSARAVYLVMNPFDAEAISGTAVNDAAIARRCWLLIDCDPQRPADTNATAEELERACLLAAQVKTYLTACGWPDPVECASGNGMHLLYRIDLPNDVPSLALVNGILQHLAATFDTPGARVDRTVGNASRITKLYGTWTRKGPHTPERPHRLSSITRMPESLVPVPRGALQHLADLPPQGSTTSKNGSGPLYDVSQVLARVVVFRTFTKDATTYHEIRCPWAVEHTTDRDTGTIFTVNLDGAVGFKCQHAHCVDRHWPEFRDHLGIRQQGCGETIHEVHPYELTHAAPTPPYGFEPAFGPEHFVSQWIDFFSAQCDAALEFFEATALLALSLVTHAMCVHLSGAAEPLRTNLYIALVGDAAASRKTTAKDFLVKVVKGLPHLASVLPEMASHEGTVEALSVASGKSALWAVDELAPQLDKLTHATYLAGILGLILELYGKTSYTYKRVSKRRKKSEGGDGGREPDDFTVTDVTFSIMGCCTPTIFNKLTTDAVESGLLPRFAIIWPTGKPERMARFQADETRLHPSTLIQRLNAIASRTAMSTVRFDDGVLDLLDREIDLPIEQLADHGLMLKRMGVMAQKVAMLSGAGRRPSIDDLRSDVIAITEEDARSAIVVVRRWIESSKRFESHLNETAFEKNLKKCLDVVRGRDGHVSRREIARRVHMEARMMKEIEQTLEQRGQIEVATPKGKTGQAAVLWKWVG